jgi:hypothetical protein
MQAIDPIIRAMWPHGIPKGNYPQLFRLIQLHAGAIAKTTSEEVEDSSELFEENEEEEEVESVVEEAAFEDGLSEEGQRLYQALRRHGAATTDALAQRTRIKRQDLPEVFAELVRAKLPVRREKSREPGQVGAAPWVYSMES